MRYYIKAGLQVKLGDVSFLPGVFDFQIGTIFMDERTASFWNFGEFAHRINCRMEDRVLPTIEYEL